MTSGSRQVSPCSAPIGGFPGPNCVSPSALEYRREWPIGSFEVRVTLWGQEFACPGRGRDGESTRNNGKSVHQQQLTKIGPEAAVAGKPVHWVLTTRVERGANGRSAGARATQRPQSRTSDYSASVGATGSARGVWNGRLPGHTKCVA